MFNVRWMMMFDKEGRYLFIGAHPDDIEIWVGGLILKLIKKGVRDLFCVVLTDGSAGTGGVDVRLEEVRKSKELLGITTYETLNLKDGTLSANPNLANLLSELIKKYKPDYLFTHRKHDRHPDHSAIGESIEKALFLATVNVEGSNYEPYLCKNVFLYVSDPFKMPENKVYIDISDVYDDKVKLINVFQTQLFVLKPYLELNLFYGSFVGLKAAEIFQLYNAVIDI